MEFLTENMMSIRIRGTGMTAKFAFSSCNKLKHSLTSLIGTVKFLSDFFTEVHKYRLQCYYSDTGSLAPC